MDMEVLKLKAEYIWMDMLPLRMVEIYMKEEEEEEEKEDCQQSQ